MIKLKFAEKFVMLLEMPRKILKLGIVYTTTLGDGKLGAEYGYV